ncbi:MAG: radical SAM protein [bacterium]|nr:radical SAM protein [bacterium]
MKKNNNDTKKKVLIILPTGQAHKLDFGPLTMSYREAPLTATTLAALVPDDLNLDVKIIDESVSKLKFSADYDLVAISLMTGTSIRGYEIADKFRSLGVTVVLGGVHVILLPEEARQHADTIVIGFAEKTWPQLLNDFVNNQLKPEYVNKNHTDIEISNLPIARRDLQKKFGYTVPNTVFATRGCRQTCDFCTIPTANFGWHKRPIGDVIDELRSIKSRRIAFNDVHLTDDPEYAKELLTAMIPLKKIWGGLAATRVVRDDELLDLLEKSGCGYLLLGFESIDNNTLVGINKGFNKLEEYKEVVKRLHDKKILIQGCFIFGMDGEDKTTFQNSVDVINELKIDIPRYALYTPYPNTDAYLRLKSEGRLLHENWQYYDTQHTVIVPDKMTPEELDAGFMWAYKNTFKVKSSIHRTFGLGANSLVSFVGNLAYKTYVRKLYAEKQRFPEGVDTKHSARDLNLIKPASA